MNGGHTDAPLTPAFSLAWRSASSIADRTDALFLTLLGVCSAMAAVLVVLVVHWCFKYRAGSDADRSDPPSEGRAVERVWALLPLLAFIATFAWAAHDYVRLRRTPADALPIYVVGKQWMWKVQHASGRREVNELHVPIGEPVRLVLASEDVIHSFYVPAFRLKQDVVPGRYTTLSFTASRLGEFRLFCSEYCGTSHSDMMGRVVVMPKADYARWQGGAPTDARSLAAQGFALVRERGCDGCHGDNAPTAARAPHLPGLLGRPVRLQDGRTLIADENYVRDAILAPARDVVAGYAPLMPSYAGQLSEEELGAIVAWLRSTTAAPQGLP